MSRRSAGSCCMMSECWGRTAPRLNHRPRSSAGPREMKSSAPASSREKLSLAPAIVVQPAHDCKRRPGRTPRRVPRSPDSRTLPQRFEIPENAWPPRANLGNSDPSRGPRLDRLLRPDCLLRPGPSGGLKTGSYNAVSHGKPHQFLSRSTHPRMRMLGDGVKGPVAIPARPQDRGPAITPQGSTPVAPILRSRAHPGPCLDRLCGSPMQQVCLGSGGDCEAAKQTTPMPLDWASRKCLPQATHRALAPTPVPGGNLDLAAGSPRSLVCHPPRHAPPHHGSPPGGQAAMCDRVSGNYDENSGFRAPSWSFSRETMLECIWLTRLSDSPSVAPISFIVNSS